MQNSKRILWFTWKDRKNPLAGGAELVNEELAKRLVKDGKEVIFLVAGFKGGKKEEKIDGFKVLRVGNRWTIYWEAFRYYKKYLQYWPDLVIDEMNTIPFFTKFYVKQKNIMFVHQLCREIWFYQMSFPVSLLGYLLETIYLRMLNDRKVITVSESTKRDLIRFGFKRKNIHIISEGIELTPITNFNAIKKYEVPTILSLGAIRPMKRTDHIIKAFEIVKKSIPNAHLILAGVAEGKYGKRVLTLAKQSPNAKDITYFGKIDKKKKIELLQKSHLLCSTSVKEGWGLVITEANSQVTPAIVYNTDGLSDSVKHNETGIICEKNNQVELAKNIKEMLKNNKKYKTISANAQHWSKEFNFDNSFKAFIQI